MAFCRCSRSVSEQPRNFESVDSTDLTASVKFGSSTAGFVVVLGILFHHPPVICHLPSGRVGGLSAGEGTVGLVVLDYVIVKAELTGSRSRKTLESFEKLLRIVANPATSLSHWQLSQLAFLKLGDCFFCRCIDREQTTQLCDIKQTRQA